MSDDPAYLLKNRKHSFSLPPGWTLIGFILGVLVTGMACGAFVILDVPAYLRPTPTPTATLAPTSSPAPTHSPSPTVTPTPMALDFGWSGVTWELLHDNPAIAVGTIRLLIDGGGQPYTVLYNDMEVTAIDGIFYITFQTSTCSPVAGVIEVQSADGQRVVRHYELGGDEVPCPAPTPEPG
jgi:hypothetical protein